MKTSVTILCLTEMEIETEMPIDKNLASTPTNKKKWVSSKT